MRNNDKKHLRFQSFAHFTLVWRVIKRILLIQFYIGMVLLGEFKVSFFMGNPVAVYLIGIYLISFFTVNYIL